VKTVERFRSREAQPGPSGPPAAVGDRFVVEQHGLCWMLWEDAETVAGLLRVKTSLALTRGRARLALRFFAYVEPDAYALGYLFNV
jgi:hypothetical protein